MYVVVVIVVVLGVLATMVHIVPNGFRGVVTGPPPHRVLDPGVHLAPPTRQVVRVESRPQEIVVRKKLPGAGDWPMWVDVRVRYRLDDPVKAAGSLVSATRFVPYRMLTTGLPRNGLGQVVYTVLREAESGSAVADPAGGRRLHRQLQDALRRAAPEFGASIHEISVTAAAADAVRDDAADESGRAVPGSD